MIGVSIVFIIIALILAQLSEWTFSWKPDGVNNLIATGGAVFVIALAIERYMKVFVVDSRDDDLQTLQLEMDLNSRKYDAQYKEYLKLKNRNPTDTQNLTSSNAAMWKIENEIMSAEGHQQDPNHTKGAAEDGGFFLGASIALLDLPLLNDIILVSSPDKSIAERILKCADLLLIGALISGGSAGITSFFDMIKARMATRT